jgi:hypothetical protein
MTTSPDDIDNPGHEGAVAHEPDDHAHDEVDILGPIDTIAWGAGVLGVMLGSAVALAFALATG